MKKIIHMLKTGIITLLIMCMISGCISSKGRDDIVSVLADDGIIHDDWTEIGSRVRDASPIPAITSYDYYYMDNDGMIYEVSIYATPSDNGNGTKEYRVTVTDGMKEVMAEKMEYDDETGGEKLTAYTEWISTEDSSSSNYIVIKNGSKYSVAK